MTYRGMAAIGKNDALPFVRTVSLDQHPVLKIQFWPNKRHGAQAAVITSHGCWTVNFSSSQPGISQDGPIFCTWHNLKPVMGWLSYHCNSALVAKEVLHMPYLTSSVQKRVQY